MKTGLVLEGGSMRGLFSAGVMDVLMENGIAFDGIVGVSAGAAFGCNYKTGQIGRAVRYNTRFAKDWRYCSFRSLFLTGDLFGARFCYYKVPGELDPFDYKAFRENPVPFFVVATEVKTGKPYYKELKDCDGGNIEWIRASASMPMVSRVVKIDGEGYLDGGVSDSIPLAFMERAGYPRNVVILTQPATYRKPPVGNRGLTRLGLWRYPRIAEAMARRHEMYNEELDYVAQRENQGDAFVIRPALPLGIGHVVHDPETLFEIYRIGRETMETELPRLRTFLG